MASIQLANANSIPYFCILEGKYIPNATIAALCGGQQTTLPDRLVSLDIGSVQDGTPTFATNPWDFFINTIANEGGELGHVELWDWQFTSSSLFSMGGYGEREFGDEGGVQILNLTQNGPASPTITKILIGDTPGFQVSGDQRGYIGNSSWENSLRMVSADLPAQVNCPPFVEDVHWNATNAWNWTLSFTNSSANFFLFTRQSFGALSVGATCDRTVNESQWKDVGVYPVFRGDSWELWANGSEPVFHNWNTSQTLPMPLASVATTVSLNAGMWTVVTMTVLGLVGIF